MEHADLRDMITGDVFRPFIIKTKGGRPYPVRHESNVWLPADYDSVVCVAICGKGITLIDIASIESVHLEVDLAAR